MADTERDSWREGWGFGSGLGRSLDIADDGSECVGAHAGLAQLHAEREGLTREVAAEHARNLGEGLTGQDG